MSILGGSASSHTCEGQHNCNASDPPVREDDEEVLVGSWVPYLAVCVLAYALIFFACCLAEFEPSTQQKPCVLTQQKACGHWHHTACLKQWYGTQLSAGRCRSCPLCKTPVEPQTPPAAAAAQSPATARAIELYNSYPRVVM